MPIVVDAGEAAAHGNASSHDHAVVGGEPVPGRELILSLHRAMAAAAHPGCAACSALLPVLSSYLRAGITPPV